MSFIFIFPYFTRLPARELCGKWREIAQKWRDDKPILHDKVDEFIVQR
jgi:hypothetical protein